MPRAAPGETALADIVFETADGRVVHLIGDAEYDGYAGNIRNAGPGTYDYSEVQRHRRTFTCTVPAGEG